MQVVLDGKDIILRQTEYVEQHHHHRSRTFGAAAVPTATHWADEDSLTPFRAISGNGAYGSDASDEANVFGSDDTPFIIGQTKFDPGSIQIVGTSVDTEYILRLVWGIGTMADAIAAGQYSTMPVKFDSAAPTVSANMLQEIGCEKLSNGTKVWIQCKNATDNATIDFYIVAHGYGG